MKSFKELLSTITKHTSKTLTERNEEVFDILGPNDIAIDCGANVGNITEKMAMRGAIVYAFEPNPHAYNILTKRFSNMPNVHCINKAVWDKTGTFKLYLHKNSESNPIRWSAGSSLAKDKGNISINDYVDVEVINLAEFISTLIKPITLLKIDIEGAECEVLHQLIEKRIAETITSILVETHEAKIPSLRKSMNDIRKKIKDNHLTNINLNWI